MARATLCHTLTTPLLYTSGSVYVASTRVLNPHVFKHFMHGKVRMGMRHKAGSVQY